MLAGASAGGVSSLIAGDVQFLAGGGGAVINAGLSGADVVMIGSIVNKGVQRVMARSDIQRPEDLRGKNVGVTRIGASSHLVLLLMLRQWGMTPNDVQTLQLNSSPAMMADWKKAASMPRCSPSRLFSSPKIWATACSPTSLTWIFTICTA